MFTINIIYFNCKFKETKERTHIWTTQYILVTEKQMLIKHIWIQRQNTAIQIFPQSYMISKQSAFKYPKYENLQTDIQ